MGDRKKGSNKHGFENEHIIVQAINNHRFKDLNLNLKKFIKQICSDNKVDIEKNTVLRAEIETNNKLKQDFYIIIEGKRFGVSLKMGGGNSIHQENIEEFIGWAKDSPLIEGNEGIYNDLRFFIWGDGTLDGNGTKEKDDSGKIISRFGCTEFKKKYPEKRKILQDFFDKNEYEILKRVIFIGTSNSDVHYIYHGTEKDGVWLSRKEFIEYNMNNFKSKNKNDRATLTVGRLTVQAWNVSLKGTKENRRGQIQFKYGSLEKDIDERMFLKSIEIGTFEGDKEELNLSKILNKNKKHRFWNILSEKCELDYDKNNYFVVKVDGNKMSRLINKKVKCKSDDFIIKAEISQDFLLQSEYEITESMLQKLDSYEVVSNSGISVKRKDSKYFTIIKLSFKSFKAAFKDVIDNIDIIFVALLLYTHKKKFGLNKKILNDIGVSEKEMIELFDRKYNINGNEVLDLELASKIKNKAKEIITEVIEDNEVIKLSLFSGKYWFEDPYYINYIFAHGTLSSDIYTNYYISTGSGRSKGTYNIILKPE